jgi:hypothetical protein
MNVLSKKTERQRDLHIAMQAGEMFLIAALLTADDIFGLNDELTDRFTNGYAEMINGYVQCGGVKAMKEELADRGIEIHLNGQKATDNAKNKHQRGRGEWRIIETEGKKKTVCSHCGKGTAVKTDYCAHCGADMRNQE